ncbi:MAG: DUF421 domain-containing protein [Mycobacteriales bacterium]
MWHQIFTLGESPIAKILRALLIYAFLVVALRVAGKRDLAQLNSFDFVVLLAVANAVQNGLIGNDNSVTGAVLGATVLFLVNGVLAYLLYRSGWLQRTLEGTPTVLVRAGVVDRHAMQRERITEAELLTKVQEAGTAGFRDVESAALEPNGTIVVVPHQPDPAEQRYTDLTRRIDELTALVRAQRPR